MCIRSVCIYSHHNICVCLFIPKSCNSQQETDNQKAGLCLALLEIGAWEQASGIIDRLPQFSLLDEDSIAKSLCFVIHSKIDPLYKRFVCTHTLEFNIYL